MNTMRVGAAGAALLGLAVATACSTSSRPGSLQLHADPAAASAAASPSPTSTPSSSPPASVRPGLAASDVSFVSAQRGWVLGSGQLLMTDDRALSWTALPAPPAGVTHLRFATSSDGYAWSTDGALWITRDGGSTWSPVSFAE